MGIARNLRRLARKKDAVAAKKPQRKAMMEPLEPRLLLSADLSYTMGGAHKDLALELNQVDGVDMFQLIDNGGVLASQAASETSGINIFGSEFDDRLVVDSSVPLGVPISFVDYNPADNDVLEFVGGGDRMWNITGPDAGDVGNVEFAGIENLIGDADNEDTFFIGAEGSLGGMLDGGQGGYDSIVLDGGSFNTVIYTATGPQSGTIKRDADVITYAGLEPITDNSNTANRVIDLSAFSDTATLSESGGNLIVGDSDPFYVFTFESITFAKPTESLTINLGASNDNVLADPDEPIPFLSRDILTIESIEMNASLIVNGEDGSDQVEITGDLILHGGDLVINAEIIRINAGAEINTLETGDNGSISLIAANEETGSELAIPSYEEYGLGKVAGGEASVSINGAVLHAGNIMISATSTVTVEDERPGFAGIATNPLSGHLSNAFVSITDAQITSTGSVSISAVSNVTTSARATADPAASDASVDAAVAVSIIDSIAVADLTGTTSVSATGAFAIGATNTINVTTRADASPASAGAAFATAVVSDTTRAAIETSGAVSADSIAINALTNRTILTNAISSKGGATQNSDATKSPNARTEGNARTSETGAEGITAAAALAFTKMDGTTEAYISPVNSSTVAATKSTDSAITIAAKSSNNIAADADAGTTKSAGAAGIGAAVAVNLSDLTNRAYIGGTGTIDADTIAVNASMPAFVGGSNLFRATAKSGQGKEGDSSVSVKAGALAVEIVHVANEALIKEDADLNIPGGSITLTASNTLSSTASAEPNVIGGELGVGIGVAVHVPTLLTRSELQDGATLFGAKDLTLNATTTPKIETTAKAGASGDSVSVGGAVAITVASTDTIARVGTGSDLNLAGALNLNARELQVVNADNTISPSVKTLADGTTSVGSVGVGAVIGLTVASDVARATTERAIIAGGAATLYAETQARSDTTAKASAKGAEDKPDTAKGQADKERTFAGTIEAAKDKIEDAKDTAEIKTSDGPVGVAAALSLNIAGAFSEAAVLDNLNAGGLLTVHSSANDDAVARSDAREFADNTVGVGAAVAVNLADVVNRAYIDAGTAVNAYGVNITADMAAKGTGPTSESYHYAEAEALSGAGAANVGVAGSFALNIPIVTTEAFIRKGDTETEPDVLPASVNAGGGDFSITSKSIVSATSEAKSKADESDDVGVGASFALDVPIVSTRAEIEDGAIVTGAKNLALSATSTPRIETIAQAGAGSETVSVGGAAALTIASIDTDARIGTFTDTMTITGSLNVKAEQGQFYGPQPTVSTTADGAAGGADVGVGAAIALTIANESVSAKTERPINIIMPGQTAEVIAEMAAENNSIAKAGAKGATSEPGKTTSNEQAEKEKQNLETSQPDAKKIIDEAKEQLPDVSTSDGAVGVAAAMAINVLSLTSEAAVKDNLTFGGVLTIHSSANVDAGADANASTVTDDTVGVGAAVAANVAGLTNKAWIGEGVTVIAGGVVVKADMLPKGTLLKREAMHDFEANAISGAGKPEVGVAGAFALNIPVITTEAFLPTGAELKIASLGNVRLEATNAMSTVVHAKSKAEDAGPVGVGASVAVNLPINITRAEIENGAVITNAYDTQLFPPGNLTVAASNEDKVETLAVAGAEGGVAVSPAVALAVVVNNTTARIGTLPDTDNTTIVGDLLVQASQKGAVNTTARGTAEGGEAAVGASVGINIVIDHTDASVERNMDIGGTASVLSEATLSGSAETLGGAKGSAIPEILGIVPTDPTTWVNLWKLVEPFENIEHVDRIIYNIIKGKPNVATDTIKSVKSVIDMASEAASAESGVGAKGVGVAAAIALNVLTPSTTAWIADDVHLDVGGAIKVSAGNETDAYAEATGSATDLIVSVNVGAAVGVNVVTIENQAWIGENAVVEAGGITVEAVTPEGKTSDFAARGYGAGGGQDFGIAGSVGINVIVNSTQASVKPYADIFSTAGVHLDANTAFALQNFVGTIGGGQSVAVGAAIAVNTVVNTTEALIGSNADLYAKEALLVSAESSLVPVDGDVPWDPMNVAVSGAVSPLIGYAGVGCSAAINVFALNTHAYIGQGARINQPNTPEEVPGADQSIAVRAVDRTAIRDIAGGLGIATGAAGVGVGLDVDIVTKNTLAFIAQSTVVQADKDISIEAVSEEDINSISASFGLAGVAGVAASVSVQVVTTGTKAAVGYIGPADSDDLGGEATVHAGGNLTISADDTAHVSQIAGAPAFGVTAGVGVAETTLVHTDFVKAFIGEGSDIAARGPEGLSVRASSSEEVMAITGAGGFSSTAAGVGASVTVNVLTEITKAYIGAGARIDATNTVINDPSVTIHASDETKLLSVAGAVGGASVAGVGAGVGVGVITKNTQAYIDYGTDVSADKDVLIDAASSEDVVAIAASGAAGGAAGVAPSAGVLVITPTTKAYIADAPLPAQGAVVAASGNVIISAADDSDMDVLSGNLAFSATAAVGVAAVVPVVTKTTEAYIGEYADVTAKGLAAGAEVNTGRFDVQRMAVVSDLPFTTGSVNYDTDAINLIPGHGLITGQPVVYSNGSDDNNKSISGLDSGKLYFAIVDGNTIKLASTREGALAGESIDLSAPVETGGEHHINPADKVIAPEIVNPSAFAGYLDTENLATQPSAVAETQTGFKGVAVTATNRDRIATWAVSGGGSATVAVNVGGSVYVLNTNTKAYIDDGARINADKPGYTNSEQAGLDQTVLVAAGNDFYHLGVDGGVAIAGVVSVTPMVDVSVANLATEAYIGDGTIVNANKDIQVQAEGQEEILTIVAGAAGSGMVSVGGSVSVLVLNTTTEAHIGENAISEITGAKAKAGGNVLVSAVDNTLIDIIAGNAGIGIGAVGVGASVGIPVVNKNTSAYIGDYATVDAKANKDALPGIYTGEMTGSGFQAYEDASSAFKGVAVQAASREVILNISVAGGGGMYAGVAGAVTVEIINSDTTAYIGRHAKINQDDAGANATQSVNVSAVNDAWIFAIAGALGGGIAGVGGGIDVGVLLNDTTAYIGDGAAVSAEKDVDVNALSKTEVKTLPISIGGGVVGAAGSVSVWSLGSGINSNYSVTSQYIFDPQFVPPVDDPDRQVVNEFENTIAFADPHNLKTGDELVYRNGGGTSIGGLTDGQTYYAIVVDSRTIKLSASPGGSEIDFNLANTTGDTHSLEHTVTADSLAVDHEFDPSYSVNLSQNTIDFGEDRGWAEGQPVIYYNSFDGSGGDIGGLVNGQTYYVIKTNDPNKIQLSQTPGGPAVNLSSWGAGDHHRIRATDVIDFVDYQANGADSWDSGMSQKNGYLSMLDGYQDTGYSKSSECVWQYTVSEEDGAANAIAAVAPSDPVSAALSETPSAGTTAYIGSGAIVSAGEDINIRATADLEYDGWIGGIAAGGGGLGASVGIANIGANVDAYIGSGATVSAITGDVSVHAVFTDNLESVALAGRAGLITLGAQVAVINDSSHVSAHVDDMANITEVGDTIDILADSDRTVKSTAPNVSIGLMSAQGASVAIANVGGETRAYLGDVNVDQDSGAHVGNIHIKAESDASAKADSWSVSTGIVTFFGFVLTGNVSVATLGPEIEASIGDNANVLVTDEIRIETLSAGDVEASAWGVAVSGGFSGGANVAVAVMDPDIRTCIGAGADIQAGSIALTSLHNAAYNSSTGKLSRVIDEDDTPKGAKAVATSVGVSLLADAQGAVAVANNSAKLDTFIGNGATVSADDGDIRLLSGSSNQADADGNGVSITLFGAVGASFADAFVAGSTRAHVDGRILDGNNLIVDAIADSRADAHTMATAGGVFGLGVTGSVALAFVDPPAPGASETVAAYIANGAAVNVDQDVSLTSQSFADAWAKADAFAGAMAGALGASVALAGAAPDVRACIGSGASVTAGSGDISLKAVHNYNLDLELPYMRQLDDAGNERAHVDALGFSGVLGGTVAGSGVFSGATASADVDARVEAGAVMSAGGSVAVGSWSHNDADAEARTIKVGGVLSIGVSVATAETNSRTTAGMDGVIAEGTNLNVETTTDDRAAALAEAPGGGIITGNGAIANAVVSSRGQAFIGESADVDVSGAVKVRTDATTRADANAFGASFGILGIGGTYANATVKTPSTMRGLIETPLPNEAFIAGDVHAGSIEVLAFHNVGVLGAGLGANANATGTSGGVLLPNIVIADASCSPDIRAYVAGSATLDAEGNISVKADSWNEANGVSSANTFGVFGVGWSDASATANGGVEAYVSGRIGEFTDGELTGPGATNLTISASATTSAYAGTDAPDGSNVAVGLFAGNGADAEATASPTIKAYIGGTAAVDVSGHIAVMSRSESDANAYAPGFVIGLGIGLGMTNADAWVEPIIETYIADGAEVSAGGNLAVDSSHNFGALLRNKGAHATATASGGGFIGDNSAASNATANAFVASYIDGATIDVAGNVAVRSRSNNKAEADAQGDTVEFAGGGTVHAAAYGTGATRAYIEDVALFAAGSLDVLAQGSVDVDAKSDAASLEVVGGRASFAYANWDALSSSAVIPLIDAHVSTTGTEGMVIAGDVSIKGTVSGDASAIAEGDGAGAGDFGISQAIADWSPWVDAYIAAGTRLTSDLGNVVIMALNNYSLTGSAPIPGNQAYAYATASGAGAVDAQGADARASGDAHVQAGIRGLPLTTTYIKAGQDITLWSRSHNYLVADADATAFGAGAFGITYATALIDNDNQALTGRGVALDAGGGISIGSESDNDVWARGTGGQGGLIAAGGTQARADVGNNTTGAATGAANGFTSGGLVEVKAVNDTFVLSQAFDTSGGAITYNQAKSESFIRNSVTEAKIGDNTVIAALQFELSARDQRLFAKAEASSETIAADSTSEAEAIVYVDADAGVSVGCGADITALEWTKIIARQDDVKTETDAAATIALGITGTVMAVSDNTLDAHAWIDTCSGSKITTRDLLVEAQTPHLENDYLSLATAEGNTLVQYVWEVVDTVCETVVTVLTLGLVDSEEVCEAVFGWVPHLLHSAENAFYYGSESKTSTINFNSDVVVLGPPDPILFIDENSDIVEQRNVNVTETADRFVVGDILNDASGRVRFSSPDGTIVGTASFIFRDTFEHVQITNESPKDLEINDIRVYNPDKTDPDLAVWVLNKGGFSYTIAPDPSNCLVEMDTDGGDVLLGGFIDNPGGTTHIHSAGGDILAIEDSALIDTRILELRADAGTVGTETDRIKANMRVIETVAATGFT